MSVYHPRWTGIGVIPGKDVRACGRNRGSAGAMDDQSEDLTELVAAACGGDTVAWDVLVSRFMPLVLSVIRRYRLSGRDAEDVSQTVWLRLVEHLDSLREPKALPGWLTVTTKNEALRTLRSRSAVTPVDPTDVKANVRLEGRHDTKEVDAELLRAERRTAVLDGLAEMTEPQRDFLRMLVADPPISYLEISRRTGMPIGSIGPTRARCLAKLRSTAPLRALNDMEYANSAGGGSS